MRHLLRIACGILLAAAACGDDGGTVTPIDAAPVDTPLIDTPISIDAPIATCLDEKAAFTAAATMNGFGVDPTLVAPLSATAPSFALAAGSPALTGGATPPNDGFFDVAATYRGAVGLAANDWTKTGTWVAYPTNETPADRGTVTTLAAGATPNILDITTSTTWTTGNTYKLPANLRVYVRTGAVLTIQPGVLVKGGLGSTIVISKDGRIDAQGTAVSPIVMTSDRATGTAGPGNWGGLILLGQARINVTGGASTMEGLDAADTARNGYGGVDDAHNCGIVKYVRIEYSGAEVSPGNEIQGLTMGGCGSQTLVDFIDIHKSSDDGIEIFGGKPNLRHVVITQTDDDGLDWDQGFTGKVQFLVVQQVLDKAIEADNNRNDNALTPVSKPTIYNATLVGLGVAAMPRGQTGPHLRRGTSVILRNSIVTELPKWALDVDGWVSAQQVTSGDLKIENNLFFHDGPAPAYEAWPTDFDKDATTMVQNDCPPP